MPNLYSFGFGIDPSSSHHSLGLSLHCADCNSQSMWSQLDAVQVRLCKQHRPEVHSKGVNMDNSLTLHVAQPAGITGAQPACLKLHKPQDGCSQLTGNSHSWATAANSGKANLAVITAHVLESLAH